MTVRRRIRHISHEEVGLQIAPMIDVTLLLLFFFMLSGKLTKNAKMMPISVPLASAGHVPENPGERDVVNIDADGQLYAGETKVTARELAAYLRQRFKDYPPLKLAVRADARTPAKQIKAVMKIASEAGAIEVIFGVKPQ